MYQASVLCDLCCSHGPLPYHNHEHERVCNSGNSAERILKSCGGVEPWPLWTVKVSCFLDSGQDASVVCYDIHYALRLCQERNLTEACVQLSALLGLWESAVDLALTVDVKLAKQTANLPQNDPDLRKKLWLKIGKFASHFLSMFLSCVLGKIIWPCFIWFIVFSLDIIK